MENSKENIHWILGLKEFKTRQETVLSIEELLMLEEHK